MARAEDRKPYVGEGADGARRSAEIDRNEADTYPNGSDRRLELLSSALRWEAQAELLEMAERIGAARAERARQQAEVLKTALEMESLAYAAWANAKKAHVRAEQLVMEARYQLSLTVGCTSCKAEPGQECRENPGVNIHRWPRQHGVRHDAAKAAAQQS